MKCQNLFSGTPPPPPPKKKKKKTKQKNKQKKKKNEEILSVCRLLKFAHRVVKVKYYITLQTFAEIIWLHILDNFKPEKVPVHFCLFRCGTPRLHRRLPILATLLDLHNLRTIHYLTNWQDFGYSCRERTGKLSERKLGRTYMLRRRITSTF